MRRGIGGAMGLISMPLRRGDRSPAERAVTGSIRFADLVWAHWAWQRSAHPHEFPRQPRWLRRWLALTGNLNGGPPHGDKSGTASSPDPEVVKRLRAAYEAEARVFASTEGPIVREYWCATEASAVVVTEKKQRLQWLPWRRVGRLGLHRVTDWVTADAPAIAELLHSGDMLAVRINEVLPAVPRMIAMEWIFSEQSYLLGLVERSGGHLSRKEISSAVARHRAEIDRLERYYDRGAKKAARIWYFGGMLVGLGAVVALGTLIPLVVELFGHLDLASTTARRFYVSFVFGALGAMVSVMTRMRQEEGLSLDYEVGELLIVLLGAFRPLLGAIFGVLTYFAIDSKLIPLTPPRTDRQFFYYAVFAFAAGFSERFAHVILGSADLSVAKGLSGGKTAEAVEPKGEEPKNDAATSRNGRSSSATAETKPPPARTEGASR